MSSFVSGFAKQAVYAFYSDSSQCVGLIMFFVRVKFMSINQIEDLSVDKSDAMFRLHVPR